MTAKEKYKENQQLIREQLLLLQEKLKDHEEAFLKSQKNWGMVGDLGYIATRLENINASIR